MSRTYEQYTSCWMPTCPYSIDDIMVHDQTTRKHNDATIRHSNFDSSQIQSTSLDTSVLQCSLRITLKAVKPLLTYITTVTAGNQKPDMITDHC